MPAMNPEEVNKYLESHNLEQILASAVNEAVSARAEDPVAFIAEVLAKKAKKSLIKAAGSGFSADADPKAAVAAVVKAAGVAKPTIAFVACTVAHDAAAVQAAFVEALPGCAIHGLTSSGAVLAPGAPTPAGVGCLLMEAADGAFATVFSAEGDAAAAAAALKAKMAEPQALIMSATPGAEEGALLKLAEAFPGVKVFGGTAADNDVSGKWSVFSADGVAGGGISLVGVGGGVAFGSSMLGPYKPTAKTAVATECDGRKVMKIGGVRASDWVLEWLGEPVKKEHAEGGMILAQTAQTPVGIKQPSGELVSSHLAILGGEDGSVTFFTPVPEGADIVVMESGDGPATGYAATLGDAFDAAKVGTPKAGLLVYCGGMAIAVGDKLGEGLSGPLVGKAAGVPVLGATCFGEQGVAGGVNVQRNLSMGMALFG